MHARVPLLIAAGARRGARTAPSGGGGGTEPDVIAINFADFALGTTFTEGSHAGGLFSSYGGTIEVVVDPTDPENQMARFDYQGQTNIGITLHAGSGQPAEAVSQTGFLAVDILPQWHKSDEDDPDHALDLRKLIYLQSNNNFALIFDLFSTANSLPGGTHEGLPGLFVTFVNTSNVEFLADYDPGTGPGVAPGVKHRFKIWYDLGTPGGSDGEVKLWLNGALVHHWTDLAFRPSGTSNGLVDLIFGQQTNQVDSNEYRWLDRIHASTVEID